MNIDGIVVKDIQIESKSPVSTFGIRIEKGTTVKIVKELKTKYRFVCGELGFTVDKKYIDVVE